MCFLSCWSLSAVCGSLAYRTPGWGRCSACGAGDEGGDDVGSVPVEGLATTVVAHGRAWVGVAGRFLHVAQRHAGVEGGGDESVPEGVWTDPLGDGSPAGDASHDPPGCVTVEAS